MADCCRNCHWFSEYADSATAHGRCDVKLPPQVMWSVGKIFITDEKTGVRRNAANIKDSATYVCALHKAAS